MIDERLEGNYSELVVWSLETGSPDLMTKPLRASRNYTMRDRVRVIALCTITD